MKKIDLNKINWEEIQKKHNDGIYWTKLPQYFKISYKILQRAKTEGFIQKKKHNRKHDEISKNKISVARKKYLKENPDKHPWKRNSKFKSKPCELLKRKLNEREILFIDEYQPSSERYYSIDIAFPNKRVGVEVNGNQHYNNDGTLKKYYVDRNNYFKSIGWKIFDIHYSIIYCDEIINNIIEKIENFSLTCNELDFYTKKHFRLKENRKRKKCCIICGDVVHKKNTKCRKCHAISIRKVMIRPTKEMLSKELNETSFTAVGKKYGVSDNAVRKWAKKYAII